MLQIRADGDARGAAIRAGCGIPSRRVRRKKCKDAGQMRLSLARRYNTLDLASKVSVPRGCGPFGNPGDEGRRRLGRRNGNFPFGAATVVRSGDEDVV